MNYRLFVPVSMLGFSLLLFSCNSNQPESQGYDQSEFNPPSSSTAATTEYLSPLNSIDQAINDNANATYDLLNKMRREQRYSSGSSNFNSYGTGVSSYRNNNALSDGYKFLARQRTSINDYNTGIEARRSVSCAVTNSLAC